MNSLGKVRTAERTFPYCFHSPPPGSKAAPDLPVSSPVVGEFLLPEGRPARGCVCKTTSGMVMPEAAVNKDYEIISGKNDVGRSGNMSGVKSETKAQLVKHRSDFQFRRRIFRPDTGHVPAAMFFCQSVHSGETSVKTCRYLPRGSYLLFLFPE